MTKVLVPTDFSANSKSGIRFAIQWAKRQKIELVFVHVLHILRPTKWSDSDFAKVAAQEEKTCRTRFEKFIAGVYASMKTKPGKRSFLIIHGFSADVSLLNYCSDNKDIDYICISTRGAGAVNKLLGTNTGNLITKSTVPVLAVPRRYRASDVKRILYASDFRNYAEEVKKVVAFGLPLKAKIEILHFMLPAENTLDEKVMDPLKKKYKYGMKIHLKKDDLVNTLVQNLQKQVRVMKPSVVVMFTNQERTFFEKIFLSSKSEQLSFQLKVPLLVFNKG